MVSVVVVVVVVLVEEESEEDVVCGGVFGRSEYLSNVFAMAAED